MNTVRCLVFLAMLGTVAVMQQSAQADSGIPVAFIEGFTGADPNTARELYRGAKLFLKKTPQAKKMLRIEKIDNRGIPAETYRSIKVMTKQGVKIVVGISKSDQAIVASHVATEENILFITPFATNTKVTEDARSTFRICFTDIKQGSALAKFAHEEFLPSRMLVLTNVDSQYSIGLAKEFLRTYKSYNSDSAIRELRYLSDNLKLADVQKIFEEFRPVLVFIPDHITRSSIFIREIHQKNPEVIFMGGDGWGGKKVFHAVYPKLKYQHGIHAYYSTHWHESIAGGRNYGFVKGYEESYPGEPITSGAALTYDAFNVLWEALRRCSFEQNVECLTTAIKTMSFSATTGRLQYKGGHNPEKNVFIIRITGSGKHELHKTL